MDIDFEKLVHSSAVSGTLNLLVSYFALYKLRWYHSHAHSFDETVAFPDTAIDIQNATIPAIPIETVTYSFSLFGWVFVL